MPASKETPRQAKFIKSPEIKGFEHKNKNGHSIKITVLMWWTRRDSNPRPLGCEPNALPAALRAHAHQLEYYNTLFGKVKKIFVAYILDLSYNISAAFDKAALVGEPAVPCNLQSATAGMNSQHRICHVSSDPGKQR